MVAVAPGPVDVVVHIDQNPGHHAHVLVVETEIVEIEIVLIAGIDHAAAVRIGIDVEEVDLVVVDAMHEMVLISVTETIEIGVLQIEIDGVDQIRTVDPGLGLDHYHVIERQIKITVVVVVGLMLDKEQQQEKIHPPQQQLLAVLVLVVVVDL